MTFLLMIENKHTLPLTAAALLLMLSGCLKDSGPSDIVPQEETFTPGTASAQWQRLLLALLPQSGKSARRVVYENHSYE